MVAAAVAGGALVGGIYTANQASKASNKATDATTASNQAALAQQQANFEATQKLLAPYVNAGTSAIGAQGNLIGLNGNDAQQSAITALQNSPYFTSQLKVGENALLQNASATGGLRGGNVQSAIGQFAPNLLAQTIQQQYANLGGLTNIGQNAAAGVGNAGAANANASSTLLNNIGSANASNALAQGTANTGLANTALGALGIYGQLGGFGNLTGPSASMTGASGLAGGGYYVPSSY